MIFINKAAGYLPRLVETEIERFMKVMGAVSLEGPKACGKTWCARHLCKSEFSLVDPTGNFSNRKYAEIDPMLAMEGNSPILSMNGRMSRRYGMPYAIR